MRTTLSKLALPVLIGSVLVTTLTVSPTLAARFPGTTLSNSVQFDCALRRLSGGTADVSIENTSSTPVPRGSNIEIRGSVSGGGVFRLGEYLDPGARWVIRDVTMSGDSCTARVAPPSVAPPNVVR